ncbi:MAG: HAD-IC family P-type ATPase [Parcubacteria group bacterium]
MSNKYNRMGFSHYTTLKKEAVFTELETSAKGLSADEAAKRLKQYGKNEIAGREVKWWHILGRQFKSPFIFILIIAALIAFFLKEMIDSVMIVVFVFINAVLGFVQEYHSEHSLLILKKYILPQAKVIRNGKDQLVNTHDLVIGDVVIVETGDIIPADLRFFSTHDLVADESTLSGESVNMNKDEKALAKETDEISKASNIGFASSKIVNGKGVGVVIAAGSNMVMGQVAKLTVETHRESVFEKGIAKFSRFILIMTAVTLMLLFGVNILIKGSSANIGELFLFSITLIVGVIPEALPVVCTFAFSRGALKMAKEQVVVKRLSAIEDLGSVEILCTDKTGTITENKLRVNKVYSSEQEKTIFFATLAASFLGEKKPEPNNSFDLALYKKLSKFEKADLQKFERVAETPFNPATRRNSVLVKKGEECDLIVRGAPEFLLKYCNNLDADESAKINKWLADEGGNGHRTMAIIKKPCPLNVKDYDENLGDDFSFVGLVSFVDPIKKTSREAIRKAKLLGIKIKILTGDSAAVAGAVAKKVGIIKDAKDVLTGEQFFAMNEKEQQKALKNFFVFARVSPQQKYKIVEMLQKKHEVGFLGEGINDAPALKLANVALVVQGAADIAVDSADIVLLSSDLKVIIDGIERGREIFTNITKYLKTTLISNFGNFYAVAIASLFVVYLPMLPVQILLLNLLSDYPMIMIAADTVDRGELRRPKNYHSREITLMAVLLGFLSTIFDFIIFALFFHNEPAVLQTNWFIASVLTEIVLIYSIRAKGWFWKSKAPAKSLAILSIMAVAMTLILPYTLFGHEFFKFASPKFFHLAMIAGVVLVYFCFSEVFKRVYYGWYERRGRENSRNTYAKQRETF